MKWLERLLIFIPTMLVGVFCYVAIGNLAGYIVIDVFRIDFPTASAWGLIPFLFLFFAPMAVSMVAMYYSACLLKRKLRGLLTVSENSEQGN